MIKVFPTPGTAAKALKDFDQDLNKQIMLNQAAGLKRIRSHAVGDRVAPGPSFMNEGHFDALADPPNPPPGPLKRRSGKLARAVKIIQASNPGTSGYFPGAVVISHAEAPYGRIHEHGARFNQKVMRVRRIFRLGAVRTKEITIGARPFLAPSGEYEAPIIKAEMEARIKKLIKKHFGD